MSQSELTMNEAPGASADLVLPESFLDTQDGTWSDAPEAADPSSDQVRPFTEAKAAAVAVGLGLVWAASVFWVQQLTTAPTLWKEPSMWIKDIVFRFLVDWSLATACFAVLSTRTISVLMALNLWVATAVLSFFVNYQRALSWLTITNQSGEGFAVAAVALEDAAPYLTILLPLSVILTYGFHRLRPRMGRQVRVAKIAVATWALVVLGMHFDHKPLHRLERFESADGIAHSYGYALTWLAESYYVDYDGLSEHALSRLKKPVDRLLQVVPPAELGERLAVIQVESLDDALVGFTIDGKPVIPRIEEWTKKGTYMRVQAPKVNGSCDSDFALLFGALPSNKMAPYRIPNFPFERSIVNVLHERGLSTAAFHGVNGTFFERRSAFEEMEFDRIVFREELIEELGIKDPQWTLEDGLVFRYATKTRKNDDRFFEFTITGTSHTPFRFSLEDHERKFFPEADDREYAYFDTINYVDSVVGKYVDALPEGTVVVVYGDHWSRVETPEINYRSQLIDEFGIVPAILFKRTAQGIEPLFEIDQKLAQSAQLRLVDVTAWIRSSLHIAPASQAPVAGLATSHPNSRRN